MYFRKKTTKTTPVLQLIRAYRNDENQPRQQILLSLGDVNIPRELWNDIANGVENKLKGVRTLLPLSDEAQSWVDLLVSRLNVTDKNDNDVPAKVAVDVDSIENEECQSLGAVLVAKKAWDTFGLTDILKQSGLSPVQQRDAMITVINRLCEPVSENALPQWVKTVALGDVIEQPLDLLSKDRFYRVSDALIANKETIETLIQNKQKTLFDRKHTILLYDLTNTYFEGSCNNNELAKRGFSKEKRFDCPLVSCGMILDENGCVIKHNTFAGNVAETRTLEQQLIDLKQDYAGAMVVIDAGISSEANLQMIKKHGFQYITVGKRPTRWVYCDEFENPESFHAIENRENKSEVLIRAFENDSEKIVCCSSAQRKLKEDAMISKAEVRLIADLDKLAISVSKSKVKDKEKINTSIGRLKERHSRVSRYYKIELIDDKLNYQRNEENYQQASMLNGNYVLHCSDKNIADQDIWHIYILLTKVENGFRNLKMNLGLRPIYHQKANRTQGHIFVSILAYHLLNWIEYTLKANGVNSSWQTIKRLLQTHCYVTTTMMTDKGKLTIRKPSKPDVSQQQIYDLLNIDLKTLPTHKSIAK